jgi:hypothetical protein
VGLGGLKHGLDLLEVEGNQVLSTDIVAPSGHIYRNVIFGSFKEGEIDVFGDEVLNVHLHEGLVLVEFLVHFLNNRRVLQLLVGLQFEAGVAQAAGHVIELLGDLEPFGLGLHEGVLSGISEVLVVHLEGLVTFSGGL